MDWLNNVAADAAEAGSFATPAAAPASPTTSKPKAVKRTRKVPRQVAVQDMLRFETLPVREGEKASVLGVASFSGHGSDEKLALKLPGSVLAFIKDRCEGNLNIAVTGLLLRALADLDAKGERLMVGQGMLPYTIERVTDEG